MTVSQTQFRAALMDPAQAVPPGLSDGHGAAAGRRFSVYRNNVAVSLTEALASGFPTIEKLIGRENFAGIAGLFLRAHPPTSPVMQHYGAAFPEFLAGFAPLAHLGYLPDCARLDLAIRQSYHAADAAPVDPAQLGQVAPEVMGDLRLTLVPAVRLVTSAWPIHAIHRFNHDAQAPKPGAQAEDVLIVRPDFDPALRLLPDGGATFLRQIMAGRTLGAALEAAQGNAPAFDLSAILTLLMQDRCIARLEIPQC